MIKNLKKVISAIAAIALSASSFAAFAVDFPDVEETAYYSQAVQELSALGVISGVEEGGDLLAFVAQHMLLPVAQIVQQVAVFPKRRVGIDQFVERFERGDFFFDLRPGLRRRAELAEQLPADGRGSGVLRVRGRA